MSEFRPNPDNPSPPRGPDPTLDPMLRAPVQRDRTGGAMWGWIAGIAVLILIGFIVAGGLAAGPPKAPPPARNPPASTAPGPATTGAAPSPTAAAPASR